MRNSLVLAFLWTIPAMAQNPPQTWRTILSAPSGACTATFGYLVIPAGTLYTCQNGIWAQASGSGGAATNYMLLEGAVQGSGSGFSINTPSPSTGIQSPTLLPPSGLYPIGAAEWPCTAGGAGCGNTTDSFPAWWTWILSPSYLPGNVINFILETRSEDSTNAAIVTVAWACVVPGGALDNPVYTSLAPFNVTNAVANGQTNTPSSFTPTCLADQRVYFKIIIDTHTNALTAPMDLISILIPGGALGSTPGVPGPPGPVSFVVNSQTTTYQTVSADFASCKSIPVPSGTFTITLVASGSQPASGQCVMIINYGSGTVTVAPSGQNINGGTSNLTLSPGSATNPTGVLVISDGANYTAQTIGAGGSSAFSSLTSGTNTTAAMLVGTGASLAASGSGSLTATAAPVGGITGLGTGIATWLATPTGANLGTALTTALPNTKGGTGGDSSGSTGIAQLLAGVWSYSTALANGITATTQSQNDNSTKLSTTAYTDLAVANAVAGVNPAVAVQAATTVAGDTSSLTYNNGASGIGATFTGTANTAITIDGYTFTAVGQRLLIKNDTQSPSGTFNGIYTLTVLQASLIAPVFTRALDYDQPSDMNNTGAIPVQNGTVNISTSWLLTSQVVTVGTTPLTFVRFSSNPANQVLAIAPGVGIAHFAGSTQTVTSSPIVAADITTNTITGTQIASSIALAGSPTTTTQSACDNSTKMATTGYLSVVCNVVETSGSPLACTAQSQTIWNNTSGDYVCNLPVTASGLTLCIGNYKTVAHAVSFVPPSGSTIYYKGVAGTTSSSTGLVSGGAAGDFICVEAVDTTTWLALGQGQGSFINN